MDPGRGLSGAAFLDKGVLRATEPKSGDFKTRPSESPKLDSDVLAYLRVSISLLWAFEPKQSLVLG